MSFKRSGDDHSALNHVQKRRVEELLTRDIPEDEACLLKNGRFTCLVCSYRPVLDTIDMLCVHRSGKKHQYCAEQFFRKRRELHQLVEKRRQEASIHGNKEDTAQLAAPLLLATQTAARNVLLRYAPYNPISSGAQSGRNEREDYKTKRSNNKGFFQYTRNVLTHNAPLRKGKASLTDPANDDSSPRIAIGASAVSHKVSSHPKQANNKRVMKGGNSDNPDQTIAVSGQLPTLSPGGEPSPSGKQAGTTTAPGGARGSKHQQVPWQASLTENSGDNLVVKPYVSKRKRKKGGDTAPNVERTEASQCVDGGMTDWETITEFPPPRKVSDDEKPATDTDTDEECPVDSSQVRQCEFWKGQSECSRERRTLEGAGVVVPRVSGGRGRFHQDKQKLVQVHCSGDVQYGRGPGKELETLGTCFPKGGHSKTAWPGVGEKEQVVQVRVDSLQQGNMERRVGERLSTAWSSSFCGDPFSARMLSGERRSDGINTSWQSGSLPEDGVPLPRRVAPRRSVCTGSTSPEERFGSSRDDGGMRQIVGERCTEMASTDNEDRKQLMGKTEIVNERGVNEQDQGGIGERSPSPMGSGQGRDTGSAQGSSAGRQSGGETTVLTTSSRYNRGGPPLRFTLSADSRYDGTPSKGRGDRSGTALVSHTASSDDHRQGFNSGMDSREKGVRRDAKKRKKGGPIHPAKYTQERRLELQNHLELTSSGWVHDPSGKWVKDEDVEFDSDEEKPV